MNMLFHNPYTSIAFAYACETSEIPEWRRLYGL
jgi:hypothetical protein